MLLRRRCSRVPHVLVSLAKGPSGRADLAKRLAITSQVGSHRGGSGTGSEPLLAVTAGQSHILDFADPLDPAGLFVGSPCPSSPLRSAGHDRRAAGLPLLPGRRVMPMSVQPRPWPEPAAEVAAAVRAAYRRGRPPLAVTIRDPPGGAVVGRVRRPTGRGRPPLPVTIRDRLGELFCGRGGRRPCSARGAGRAGHRAGWR